MPSNLPSRQTQLVVGTLGVALLSLGTAVAAFTGTIRVRDNIDFRPNGTTTGATIQVNGITEYQTWSIPCSATGGNVKTSYDGTTGTGAKYNTCLLAMPFTTSGAITQLDLSCGNVAKALPGDLSIVKGRLAGSGTALPNFSNVSLGTGATFFWGSGRIVVNQNYFVKFNTLTTPGATADCKLRAVGYDKYGN